MQGCKAYRLCSVAVLNELGKGWWIDMKSVQISEELFVAIMRYFMLEQEELLPQIKPVSYTHLDVYKRQELLSLKNLDMGIVILLMKTEIYRLYYLKRD